MPPHAPKVLANSATERRKYNRRHLTTAAAERLTRPPLAARAAGYNRRRRPQSPPPPPGTSRRGPHSRRRRSPIAALRHLHLLPAPAAGAFTFAARHRCRACRSATVCRLTILFLRHHRSPPPSPPSHHRLNTLAPPHQRLQTLTVNHLQHDWQLSFGCRLYNIASAIATEMAASVPHNNRTRQRRYRDVTSRRHLSRRLYTSPPPSAKLAHDHAATSPPPPRRHPSPACRSAAAALLMGRSTPPIRSAGIRTPSICIGPAPSTVRTSTAAASHTGGAAQSTVLDGTDADP